MPSTKARRLVNIDKYAHIKVHYLAILNFLEEKSKAYITRFLKITGGSLNKWVSLYLDCGLEGLKDHANPGRPTQSTPNQ
jgi:hypothetical protein